MQRDMLRTAQHLIKRGHQVEIYAMRWEGDIPDDIKVHVLPQKGFFNFLRYQQFIEAAFKSLQHHPVDYIVGYNRMAGLDAHFAADPCFIERAHSQRNFLYRLLPRNRWFSACEKAVFSNKVATEVLAVSMTEKAHFQKWYGIQDARYHYIPPFLSAERFANKSQVLQNKPAMRAHLRQTFAFADTDFVYLLTGSGFAMKGLDRAIIALAALPVDLRAQTKLVAVGQDNPGPFIKIAKKLGVEAHVVISKGRTDIPQLMQGADVAVHPAYRENTGLVILEAMACAAPILLTESCGYASHVVLANAGIVHGIPFNQTRFNADFLAMRTSADKALWAQNGLDYAETIMQANDGSAEANILIDLAQKKANRNA